MCVGACVCAQVCEGRCAWVGPCVSRCVRLCLREDPSVAAGVRPHGAAGTVCTGAPAPCHLCSSLGTAGRGCGLWSPVVARQRGHSCSLAGAYTSRLGLVQGRGVGPTSLACGSERFLEIVWTRTRPARGSECHTCRRHVVRRSLAQLWEGSIRTAAVPGPPASAWPEGTSTGSVFGWPTGFPGSRCIPPGPGRAGWKQPLGWYHLGPRAGPVVPEAVIVSREREGTVSQRVVWTRLLLTLWPRTPRSPTARNSGVF